ncbi:CHAT domain-containing protein [Dactylosporangium sp. AC04546]|uniref:CHAT domain-containing protein n=1 Tax=Dactylosporangium sp. AC04546 TaxID=2862460 RepID=UPI001EE02ED6|nr:CHAT domain-containing protein [Dactylosporangium sp. AC04546]WVK81857.1 CHAT domain-containing protein [Dactylosporangium sp. AC04546]
MRRIIVEVSPSGPDWAVTARTAGDAGAGTPLGAGHTMEVFTAAGRRLPMVPADRRTPTGDALLDGLCAGDAEAAAGVLRRLRTRQSTPADVVAYGRWLFECLLRPVWAAIGDDDAELALRWPVPEADLHRLVWESMRTEERPLAGLTERTVAITRLVPSPATKAGPVAGIPVALFATGMALADPTIRPGAMYMGLLQQLDVDGVCRARTEHGVTIDKLREACARHHPDVVHLVAHGRIAPDGRGELLLGGGLEPCDAEQLFQALAAGRPPLAVMLSACNTASAGESAGAGSDDPTDVGPLAAQLVAAGVPIVSAMSGEISEPACRLYTRRLIHAVHCGASFVAASAHGRRAALLRKDPEALDWALPALYLAEQLDPAARMVDEAVVRRLVGLARSLKLPGDPLHVGRGPILKTADEVVEGAAGVLAVLAKDRIRSLGGTRLLREIGWRILRDGHLPLFIAGNGAAPGPQTARALVKAVLEQVHLLVDKLGLDPFPLRMFQVARHPQPDLGAEARADRLLAVGQAIYELDDGAGPVPAPILRTALGADLDRLCDEAAARWGAPFGRHTRAVLLCDDAHRWATPDAHTGLGLLLEMVDSFGLGSPHRPIPVILTGSRTEDAGSRLHTFAETAAVERRIQQLGELGRDDMLVGYQWVLLHPDRSAPDGDPRTRIYTVRDGQLNGYEMALDFVGSRPGKPDNAVHVVAARIPTVFEPDNDEAAWHAYTQLHPGATV